ncbi:MAG: type II secretion system F family protein [Anaerolineales bacterium]|jgi:tight adherence protein B
MSATLLAGVLAGTAVLLVLAALVLGGQKDVVEERLSQYTETALAAAPGDGAAPVVRASPLADLLESRFAKSGLFSKISRDLARADLKLRPAEYIALIAISGVFVGILAGVLARSIPFALLGVIAGLFIPGVYVRSRQGGRLHAFENQLPDMINLTVNSLRAGYSVMQALEAVAKEMPAPISMEIHRVVQEMQLGVSLEPALEGLLRRMPSADLKLMVTAMNIQREVGGNLAEILDTISFTIRERIRIKGEIRVLTSQQRFTGYLVAAIPFALGLFLYFINRKYIMTFFSPDTRTCGIPMLILGLVMILAGFFAVQKVAAIEV